jgi:hypothetical protein
VAFPHVKPNGGHGRSDGRGATTKPMSPRRAPSRT